MTIEINQEELKKHRDIILATINYSLEQSGSEMKIDGKPVRESYYQKLRQKTDRCFKKGRLEELEQIIAKVVEYPLNRAHLSFDNYIKEKTGYEINIFKNVQERVDSIIQQNGIKNNEEFLDVNRLLAMLLQQTGKEDKINILRNLCSNYYMRGNKTSDLKERDNPNKKFIQIPSPDKKFNFTVSESEKNGERGTTTVLVNGPNGGASIYCAGGVNLEIKAFWKNNKTIIIETKKGYKVLSKHHQIQFLNHVIDVNVIEN